MDNATELLGKIKDLSKEFGSLAMQVGSAAYSFTNLNNGMSGMSQAMQSMAGHIPVIGGLSAAGIGQYNTMAEGNNELSRIGAGSSATQSFANQAGAAMTPAEMLQFAKDNVGGIRAAPTMEEQTDVGSRIIREAKETEQARKRLSVSTTFNETIAKATSIVLKYGDAHVKTNEDFKRAGLAVTELAVSMEDQARLTGQSIDSIASETRERLASARNTAFMNTLSGQQREQFGKTMGQLQQFGPEIQGLAEKIASGGRRTDEQKRQLGAMGSSGVALQNAVRASMSAGNDPAKLAQANKMMEDFMRQYRSSDTQKRLFNIADKSAGPIAGAAATLLEKQAPAAQPYIAQQQRMGPGTSMADVDAAINRRQGLEGEGRVGAQTADANARNLSVGDIDPRKAVSGAINLATVELQKNTAAMASSLNLMIDEFRTVNPLAESFANILGKMYGTGTIDERAKKFKDSGEAAINWLGGNNTAAQTTSPTQQSTNINAPAGYNGTDIQPVPVVAPISRNVGSLGATGKLIEDFGRETPALLHGRQGVLSENVMIDIVNFARNYKAGDNVNAKSILSAFESNKSSINSLAEKTNQKNNMPNIASIMSGMRESLQSPETKSEKMPAFNMPFDDLASGMKDKFAGVSNIKMPFDDLASGMKDKFAQFSKMNFPKPDFDEIKGPEFNKLPILSDLIPEEFSKSEKATAQPQSNEPLPKSAGIPTDINPTNMGHVFDQLNRTMGQMASGMGQLVNISHSIKDSNGKIAKHSSKLTGARKAG